MVVNFTQLRYFRFPFSVSAFRFRFLLFHAPGKWLVIANL